MLWDVKKKVAIEGNWLPTLYLISIFNHLQMFNFLILSKLTNLRFLLFTMPVNRKLITPERSGHTPVLLTSKALVTFGAIITWSTEKNRGTTEAT